MSGPVEVARLTKKQKEARDEKLGRDGSEGDVSVRTYDLDELKKMQEDKPDHKKTPNELHKESFYGDDIYSKLASRYQSAAEHADRQSRDMQKDARAAEEQGNHAISDSTGTGVKWSSKDGWSFCLGGDFKGEDARDRFETQVQRQESEMGNIAILKAMHREGISGKDAEILMNNGFTPSEILAYDREGVRAKDIAPLAAAGGKDFKSKLEDAISDASDDNKSAAHAVGKLKRDAEGKSGEVEKPKEEVAKPKEPEKAKEEERPKEPEKPKAEERSKDAAPASAPMESIAPINRDRLGSNEESKPRDFMAEARELAANAFKGNPKELENYNGSNVQYVAGSTIAPSQDGASLKA